MICRILENIKYTGDDEYERTIEDDIFEKAVQLKNSKGGTRETDSNEVKFLKYHTVCAECGGRFTRRSKYKTREKWMCSCGCKTDVYIDDKFYYSRICGIFNRVILNSELLKCPTTLNEYTPNLDVVRKDKEISRILDQAEVQFSPVKQMIFDLTSAKFDCCHLDNSGAYTDLLMDYLRERPLMEQIELDLLKQTVSDITVKKDGEIAIRFVNEKEISSETEEDLNDGNNASITENRN